MFNRKNYLKGFTLIELLIVIAILGVLAVVVLVAINPVQQLARTRDAGRKSSVAQIGHAVAAYYTARNGAYTPVATWSTELGPTGSGELSNIPAEVAYAVSGTAACTTNVINGTWCYNMTAGTNAIVSARLESNAEISKCTSGNAYFVYSVTEGRAGLICSASEPGVSATMTWNAVQ